MRRCHRQPVSGAELAREAGISLRTLYRDMVVLQEFCNTFIVAMSGLYFVV